MIVRAIIVDDEALARQRIRRLLERQEGVEVVAEAADGEEAVEAIRRTKPDLVFLDIQMPELDGFGVIEAVGVERMPHTIFVTAYDQHAVRAFELQALDYLLKPFPEARFQAALRRAVNQIVLEKERGQFLGHLEKLLRQHRQESPTQDRFLVKARGRIIFVKADDLDWVEAAANYVVLHAGAEEYVLREGINRFEKALDPRRFVRCHRSAIVNLDAIKEIQPHFRYEYVIILRTGHRLTLSRTYRANFQKYLNPSLES